MPDWRNLCLYYADIFTFATSKGRLSPVFVGKMYNFMLQKKLAFRWGMEGDCIMNRFTIAAFGALSLSLLPTAGSATFVSLGDCTGAVSCSVTDTPPNPVTTNPNDGQLLAWNEVQNFVLTEDLRVDRVFDTTASFVEDAGGGDYFIKAGTIVSSHYLQWDPGEGSSSTIDTTIALDSQIFAFITADSNLFASDFLGLPGLDYNDFSLRGLESGDTTDFNGLAVDINWTAGSPGDWTRLITAYSPGGVSEVPLPAGAPLMITGLAAFGWFKRKRK
ncbi:hypothetical protein CW354_04465 [Marinicaulis flavus]|uniref:PEP-CTERM protein-sorting domain-containing protein n=2 Tax=Hyphococcus luteus TaxID=2058213 RepID=A0A2S7K9S6_9PROT|nr:hypothetical protein CW354_04465 [Marinicaulis flavus]